jgi:ABC-type nitrate/sulfonate/bicarbonate transport system ATPase subunit
VGFEKFYPRQLSGGMKKRLSIARALAVEPKLLIFDESFGALDFDLRRALFDDLKEIWKRTQTTILLITHDPRDIEQIAQSETRLGGKA